jgi:sugar lactone lactonase YvrE
MKRTLLLLASLAAVAVAGAQAGSEQSFPATIRLPDGFQPEGIAIAGNTFYVGSIPTGAIYRGDLRTGKGAVLVAGGSGKAAIGVEANRGRLFVAGGPTGKAFVYSATTGRELASYQLTTAATFVNDVVVTRTAAWFTDSVNKVLYRVPLGPNGRPGSASAVRTVPLTGAIVYVAGFNVNGIDATPDGKRLVLVQSNTGKLFSATPDGVTREIDLGGGSVPSGDGLLLEGKTLFVVQNFANKIARIVLSPGLTSGRITGLITDSDFDVPTTIDDHGTRLYAVNARFSTPPTPTTRYDVVQVAKR